MANGYNRVFLIGNLGDEPVIRNTSTGSIVANITVAINEVRRDQQTGNLINETEWVRVVAFGRTAEIMQNYLHKGSQVHIEGKLRTRSYEDKNTGEKKYSTEVVCDPNGLLMLGSRQDNQNAGAYGQRDDDYAQSQNTYGNNTLQRPNYNSSQRAYNNGNIYGNGGAGSSSYQNQNFNNQQYNANSNTGYQGQNHEMDYGSSTAKTQNFSNASAIPQNMSNAQNVNNGFNSAPAFSQSTPNNPDVATTTLDDELPF